MGPFPDDISQMSAPQALAGFSNGWKSRVRATTAELPFGSHLFPFDGRDPRASEQYKLIRTKLVQSPRALCMLAVSSPQLGDGKSITSANIAGALALKKEISVLLVDGDLRRSALAGLLDVPRAPGLVEVLNGDCTLEDAVVSVQVADTRLHFLAAGRRPNNPAELLAS